MSCRFYLDISDKEVGYNANVDDATGLARSLVLNVEGADEGSFIRDVTTPAPDRTIVVSQHLIGFSPGQYLIKGQTVIVK